MWEAVLKQQQAAGFVPDCHGTSPINPPTPRPPHSHRPQPLLPPFLPPKLNDRWGNPISEGLHQGSPPI
ncbi:hypothetical protein PBY51_003335 [Eleginops maclovinus]|uniref:Uncharacterized protein n=1 Tax=Eleginops maclovinus TaxID=56733 RepID=A0AAN7XES0_ELEMC|nr:hypothetical protein PBY51_003335 [Eleginops maclovinus]